MMTHAYIASYSLTKTRTHKHPGFEKKNEQTKEISHTHQKRKEKKERKEKKNESHTEGEYRTMGDVRTNNKNNWAYVQTNSSRKKHISF